MASFAAHETIGATLGIIGVIAGFVWRAVGPEGQGDCSIGKAILHPTGFEELHLPFRVTCDGKEKTMKIKLLRASNTVKEIEFAATLTPLEIQRLAVDLMSCPTKECC